MSTYDTCICRCMAPRKARPRLGADPELQRQPKAGGASDVDRGTTRASMMVVVKIRALFGYPE